MAGPLLIPVSVNAKVVKTATPVPALGGKPFNRDASLEAGVHIHWALPDALTSAKILQDDPAKATIFPGVPDLWLVVRFNPAPVANARIMQRTWTEWVVDSRTETSTPLATWKLPSGRDPNSVHTFAGMLPVATAKGYPGWGLWDPARTDFDPEVAAYYPTARHRFGFYDDLKDIGFNGNVSYTVVGWYSIQQNDPLHMSSSRSQLLAGWKLGYSQGGGVSEVGTRVVSDANLIRPSWTPQTLTVTDAASPLVERVQAVQRVFARAGTPATRMLQLSTMQKATGFSEVGAVSAAAAAGVFFDTGPSEINCHGSVMAVSLAAAASAAPALANEAVHVYPSVKRAMAAVAGLSTSTQDQDFVEMMLQDLDHLKGSAAGILDMPGAAHALSFQGAPGKSSYFAQLEVYLPQTLTQTTKFVIAALEDNNILASAGHWPEMSVRSASVQNKAAIELSRYPGAVFRPAAPQPTGPSQADITAWIAKVRAAFNTAATAAAAAGTPIDSRMLRVVDSRSKNDATKAQPYTLGLATGRGGSDGSSSWLDIQDDAALTQVLKSAGSASIILPDAGRLYESPGPRWYRPWSPQIVIFGGGRSYRFGFDGRLDPNGILQCRRGGEELVSISVADGKPVAASLLMWNAAGITSVAGLPGDTKALLLESLLLDTESASTMAAAAGSPANKNIYATAVQGLWLSRQTNLARAQIQALGKIVTKGTKPNPIAITPWQDPRDPLFLDANYSHPRSAVETDWALGENEVEFAPATPGALNPPAAQVEVFDERSRITATIAKVLDTILVKRTTLNARGLLERAQKPPQNVTDQTFTEMDVLSAPLTGFDAELINRGFRQRTGALRVNRLEVVDVFGFTRTWNSGVADPKSSEGGNPIRPWWTDLTPRLPYWSRLQFRLQSAANIDQEATATDPAVCGFLMPDFLEHALEVFDGSGHPIGQLNSDRPQFGSTSATTLKVRFEVHPWVAASLGMTPASDPLTAITDPTLQSIVAAMMVQSQDVPAGASAASWFETGLTGFLRVVDTVRGTLDPTRNTADKKIYLMGEPVVVMRGRLTLQTAASTNPADLRKDSGPMATPPDLPTIPVQIGDVTRPDDGVLACFLPGDTPANSHMAPVSKEAAAQAVLNGLTQSLLGATSYPNGLPVQHPFIKDQVSVYHVQGNSSQDVILLCDPRGGVYATPGVLPRKKIVIPKEFLDAGLKNMEPSISVGPILSTVRSGTVRPYIPPPSVEGYNDHFIYRQKDDAGGADTYPETSLPPLAPAAELPKGRVRLDEGWVLLSKASDA